MGILFDPTSGLVAEMIRATAVRHRILASNLANVETPGYQAQEATFSSALAEAQGHGARGAGLPLSVGVVLKPDPEAPPRRDGNNVDLDRQMVKLAQNTIWHTALIQILTSRLSMMKAAVRERG
jgi:flagellar basal-body rod protein FlgB